MIEAALKVTLPYAHQRTKTSNAIVIFMEASLLQGAGITIGFLGTVTQHFMLVRLRCPWSCEGTTGLFEFFSTGTDIGIIVGI